MDPRRILLAISGGIAAYKTPELVRALRREGHEVRCALTPEATRFVAPLSLQAVSGKMVRMDLFDPVTSGLPTFVRGLREDIDDLNRLDAISDAAQERRVSGERHRVTADEHERHGSGGRECGDPGFAEPRSRRIGDDDVDRHIIGLPACHFPSHDAGVTAGQIVLGVEAR